MATIQHFPKTFDWNGTCPRYYAYAHDQQVWRGSDNNMFKQESKHGNTNWRVVSHIFITSRANIQECLWQFGNQPCHRYYAHTWFYKFKRDRTKTVGIEVRTLLFMHILTDKKWYILYSKCAVPFGWKSNVHEVLCLNATTCQQDWKW